MALPDAPLILTFSRTTRAALAAYPVARAKAAIAASMALTIFYRGSVESLYDILWAVVFGFATLNILSLAARRFEPERRGLSFGELMAITVVVIAVFLLGWEMLGVFHIFPIKLGH
jgi:glucan phosphoethanolaminetransferase (alkaline phosphatase superfamily)